MCSVQQCFKGQRSSAGRSVLTSLSPALRGKAEGDDASEQNVRRFHVPVPQAAANEVQRRTRRPWYQLVPGHIMPRLCCPGGVGVDYSRDVCDFIPGRCLPAAGSQPPTG
uniref:PPUP9740 n=1 Tax=Poeciliopsis prolifica TaxID=188132 RepID=A0A0S7EGN9_9TELE